MSDKKRSGWFYLFVSCGVLFLGGVLVFGVVAVMVVRWGNNFKGELENPEVRTEKAREFLFAENLPEGYHAALHFNAPFGLMRMVMLTDGSPSDRPGRIQGEHMFLYVELPGWDSDWKEFANGGPPRFDDLDDLNIHIDRRERLATGDLVVGKMEIFYAVNRGEISGEGYHSDDGVFSIMLVRCPEGNKRHRTVVWSGPPSDVEEDPVSGTTGDPRRIAEMLENFQLCG